MKEKQDWFPESFSDAVESWFSADIACCDECHDDFVALWPHAYSADDAAFQRSAIDLDTFYEGSQLADLFTKEEFDKFKHGLVCSRCGSQLGSNMWPYEFPFDVDHDVEQCIKEIGQLARSTPFLLLKHKFCQRVQEVVSAVGSTLKPIEFRESLFRARAMPVEITLSAFDFPPRHVVKEGRYNHAGNPVLYLGSDAETCFEEMRRTHCAIVEFVFNRSLRVLDLATAFDGHREHSDELLSLSYSALMSAKQPDDGWHRPAYVFSRFVADCARASGIEAIKYPSTRITKKNFNLVILDSDVTLQAHADVSRFTEQGTPSKEA